MKELAQKYDHKQVEEGKYNEWVEKGYFNCGDKSKDPFTIVIPPPNVTGILHIGHAWDNTLQDIISRYKRLQGYDMLYLPGMDHAGIATQAKVDARLKESGISRYDIGREKFLEHAWAWKEEYAATIRKQWAKLGNSLDYSKERFTMDEGFNNAVKHVFVKLYEEGLIYRGYRIINWDPEALTALSNIEVIYKDDPGKMYYFNYQVAGSDESFVVATTRPETMFGDVCVVVNPEDERYKHLIGKKAINPANHEELIIIGDEYVDVEFGTGAMKCTPAHDPNDFEIAERHNLEKPICMNSNATMNALCGEYEGMDRYECRDKLVERIEKEGNLIKIEDIVHNVGHSERTDSVVEPYLSEQWFVKMKPLAEDVLKHQKEGDPERIIFYPERFSKTFESWLENIEDWCISRQLWWGHRIPAYYHNETGEMYVGEDEPKDIENYHQDEDVLDTWFSSALWPFATLGWPEDTEDLARYYPTSTMVTGYDIIFFWVARMAFQARHFTNNRPFKDVLIHGLIRDAEGRKMSKSLGNGVDPMDVIEEYGVDALRFFLTTNSTPGQDMRYIPEKVEAAWNFINKLWNASRFVLMNLDEDTKLEDINNVELSISDKWILTKLNETISHVTDNMEKYEFALVGNELYSFVWNDFCSWYLEMSKSSLNGSAEAKKATQTTLLYSLHTIVRLLEPFMPFVCEEIYQALPHDKESINLEVWPTKLEGIDTDTYDEVERVLSAIQKIREVKLVNNLKPKDILRVLIKDLDGNTIELDEQTKAILEKLGKVEYHADLDGDLSVETIKQGSLYIPSSDLLDTEEEIKKLNEEKKRLEAEIKRSEGMLSNEGFLAKAPESKIEEEKNKQIAYKKQYEVVVERLKVLENN